MILTTHKMKNKNKILQIFSDNVNTENPQIFKIFSPTKGINVSGYINNGIISTGESTAQYHLASVGKIFTAIIVLQLLEEQKLSLNHIVAKYIEFPLINNNWKHISQTTIYELMGHKSGIPDYYIDKNQDRINLLMRMIAEPDIFWSPMDTIDWAVKELPFNIDKRKVHYSDTNYQILGLIIEKAESKPLYQVLKERIFDPCSMDYSYMPFYSNSYQTNDSIAKLMYRGIDLSKAKSISMSWGGGGVVSTVGDQIKFLSKMNSYELVSRKSIEIMKCFQPMSFGIQYGLGLMKFSNIFMPRRMEIWGHSGSIGSYLFYNENSDIYFAGTISKVNGVVRPIVQIIRAIQSIA